MLWVYGEFMFGTVGKSSLYTVQSFITFHRVILSYIMANIVRDNDDMLVVSFSYRLNMYGQPNAPQLAGTTNSRSFGLLDLNAVLQWVHNNIAAFGGDPARIMFGP